MSNRTRYALALALAVGTGLTMIWMIGALGIIGAGGEPDRLYVGVLGAGLLGSLLARLRASGMVVAMAATVVALVAAGAVALTLGLQDEPGASVAEVLGLTVFFAVPLAVAGGLFRSAAAAPTSGATRGT